jgi:acyl-CoA thioester hydrolase
MHKISYRVYYEDTDSGGVVYYANYLKFAERSRTELLRFVGINQSELLNTDGVLFVVRHVEMDLLKAARLDDLIDIHTSIEKISGASCTMQQIMYLGDEKLNIINVKIACVNKDVLPSRIPLRIKEKLASVQRLA